MHLSAKWSGSFRAPGYEAVVMLAEELHEPGVRYRYPLPLDLDLLKPCLAEQP
jgi:hypothetical protein